MKKRAYKKFISVVSVFALLISLCGFMTLAAQDPESTVLRNTDGSARTVSETIVINANADNGDQECSLEEDLSVPDGDGVDLYATDGYSGKVSAKNIHSGWYGAWLQTSGEGSNADLSADGIVSENADAVIVTAEQNATAEAAVNGNITAESGTGLNTFAVGSANVSFLLNGAITAGGGMNMNAKDAGDISGSVNGDIITQYAGIYAFSNNQSRVAFSLAGNVSSKNSAGMIADAVRNSDIQYTITGNVKAAELGAEFHAREDSTVVLSQTGNLSGSPAGLFSSIPAETGKIRAIVDGTIYGENAGVLFDTDAVFSASGLDLLVWKIETGEGGYLAADQSFSGGTAIYTENETFEGSIKYIVKAEQPAEGGSFTVTDENGNALPTSDGYPFARAGSKLLLQIETEEGFLVTSAYNGLTEQTALDQDENGTFYLIVPENGGIYLTIHLEKSGSTPSGSPTDPSVPKTGDTAPTIICFILLAASLLAAVVLLLCRQAGK